MNNVFEGVVVLETGEGVGRGGGVTVHLCVVLLYVI